MSYLKMMYGEEANSSKNTPNKNPNRVVGGIKAQGVDSFSLLGEDGVEKKIPTQQYVQGLEEQIRQQRNAIAILERKLARLSSAHESLESYVNNLR